MTTITIYALFGDDTRVLVTDKNGDPIFWTINIVVLILFGLEIILASLVNPGYFNGFFFYLDIVSTISLLLDIGWVTEHLFDTTKPAKNSSSQQLQKAGRASRVGTRTGRIVRIVRLVRLIKLYKRAQQLLQEQEKNLLREQQFEEMCIYSNMNTPRHKQRSRVISRQITSGHRIRANSKKISSSFAVNKNNSKDHNNINKKQIQQVKMMQKKKKIYIQYKQIYTKNLVIVESKVGQRLSDLTTQRVIVLVLSIMISVPLFDYNTYIESVTTYGNGLSPIYAFQAEVETPIMIANMKMYIDFHKNQRKQLIEIVLKETTNQCCSHYPNSYFPDDLVSADTLRSEEKFTIELKIGGKIIGYSIIDERRDVQLNAILSIVRTIFISLILTSGAIFFTRDAENLILIPINNMIKKVKRIAENPLEAAQMEEREALAFEQLVKDGNIQEIARLKELEKYETTILEKLIIKIGALLAIGFGEAGSQIIAQNMKKGGEVDPLIPGKKIMAIFGFCDIRNFTDATEVLQTGVMVFVNEIAEIAHAIVDQYLGQANKNIGDSFLLVWKFQENDYFFNVYNQLELKKEKRISELADLPIHAFLNIMAQITLSKKLQKYQLNAKLNQRLPNFKVKMGFGLHVGWAIEGAIGSNYKIDASYLSPNVNMSARLEAATKQFGTNLLISGKLYEILTPKCQKQCRHIDRVLVKGSLIPMNLYTVDVNLQNIIDKNVGRDMFQNQDKFVNEIQKKKHRVQQRLLRNKLKEDIISLKVHISDRFKNNKELIAMREFFTEDFYKEWNYGFQNYLEGNWKTAYYAFQKTLDMLIHVNYIDGPSNTLIEVIQYHNMQAPQDWQGFRALTEK
ncbi:hypothetical protein IMG5_191510 [Ichthyophthirius multifiliis]|uniref:Guanylate cyclase domain-containing protein n=1 Tax=Ichthyophthirius multifiliis TaxID=5932 RepID=G0R4D8_ICHMU|nr:hypothetical protein IMG5_191510 [Ichthyophthirius multifiliis]EGR27667.1 hypothetical protein IMG5_191510 [Ichthyophthirius multifiliis]|eukprot:XP_004025119.1 hypothetical protein IMG5_191510 [Ichthyophthirius multifiliis]